MSLLVRYGLLTFVCCFFLQASAARAQEFRQLEDTDLDLPKILALAMTQNPKLLESLADLGVARLQVSEAYLGLNPTLDLTATYLYAKQNTVAEFPDQDLELEFTLPVYTFGQVSWNAKAAKFAQSQAGQDLRTTVETLLQNVQRDYVTALLAIRNAEIAQIGLKNRQHYLEIATDLLEAGEVAEFEVIQAEANVFITRERTYSSAKKSATALADLLAHLGVRPDTQVTLGPLESFEPPPPSLDEGMARALKRRPEIAALRWKVLSQQAQARASGLGNAPTLAIYSEFDDLNEGVSYTRTWEVGLELTWSIFDGGAAANAKAQNLAKAEKYRQQLAEEMREVSVDVTKAYVEMVNIWPQIDLTARAVAKSEDALTIATARFEGGLSSGLELLNSQNSLVDAYSTQALSQANYRLAQIDWRRAISADYPEGLPLTVPVKVELPGEDDVIKPKKWRRDRQARKSLVEESRDP